MQERTRNFATVVYPESAPENWERILEEHCVPAFISPLHDKDIDAEGKGNFCSLMQGLPIFQSITRKQVRI